MRHFTLLYTCTRLRAHPHIHAHPYGCAKYIGYWGPKPEKFIKSSSIATDEKKTKSRATSKNNQEAQNPPLREKTNTLKGKNI